MGEWCSSLSRIVRLPVAAALLIAATGTGATAAADSAAVDTSSVAGEPSSLGADGIELVSLTEVGGNPRLLDAEVRSTAIFEPIKVRIYLPESYETDTGREYPTLYLLHGGDSNWEAWSTPGEGNMAAIVDDSPFEGIVVMPEAGLAGWYTDWLNPSRGGYQPLWESFHIEQLVPWIDASFRTIDDRSGRAMAGLSMGGFGALKYAALHPDLFSAVGSFSGATDITDTVPQQLIIANALTVVHGASISAGAFNPPYLARDIQDVFGPYNSGLWEAQNPLHLAGEYSAYDGKLGLYSGHSVLDFIEVFIRPMNDRFHAALLGEEVDHRYCAGSGRHAWSYWREELVDFLDYVYGTTPATCPNGWGDPRG